MACRCWAQASVREKWRAAAQRSQARLTRGASTPGYAADGSEFNSTNPTDAESESARSDEQTAIQGIVQNMLRHRK